MKLDLKSSVIVILLIVVAFMAGKMYNMNSDRGQQNQNMSSAPDPKLIRQFKQKEINRTIRENARDLQKCYLTFLEKKTAITEGVIKVVFQLKENGNVEEIKVVKNDFSDDVFGRCVADKIKTYYFAPPPPGINRNIDHELAFKSQETAEREAKEWAEKQKLPKILPVGPKK